MKFPENLLEPFVFEETYQLEFDFCDPWNEINLLISEHIKNQIIYGSSTIKLIYDGKEIGEI